MDCKIEAMDNGHRLLLATMMALRKIHFQTISLKHNLIGRDNTIKLIQELIILEGKIYPVLRVI